MAVSELKIPEAIKDSVRQLLELDETKTRELAAALSAAQPGLLVRQLAMSVASNSVLSEEDATDAVEALAILHYANSQMDLSDEEFSLAVVRSLKMDNPQSEEIYARRLTELLPIESAAITSKALGVARSHERVFSRARIITDIRPVFRAEITDSSEPAGAVVIHMLGIKYHEGNVLKEFHVALDGKDIEQLSKLLDRAEKKEQSCAHLLQKAAIPILREE